MNLSQGVVYGGGETLRRVRDSLGTTFARRLFLDRKVAFWLGEIDAQWSLDETRARVVDVVRETSDVKTFVLRPHTAWRAHHAGQFATLEVEVGGVRVRRCYSISSAPTDPLVSISVKRVTGGKVSNWVHDNLRKGDIVHLGPAGGEFVLPELVPRKLLLLSGGSGVTPVMSILRDLAARGTLGDVVMLHCARSRVDIIFRREIEAIAARHPAMRLVFVLDDDTVGKGGFDEARLRDLVPDFATRETFLCGPSGLMDRVEALFQSEGASDRLHRERFVAPVPKVRSTGDAVSTGLITLGRSGKSVQSTADGTLLTDLEGAGERPASGCRMGICQSCKCRKKSGSVQNVLTGEVSSDPDEDIQLCISIARSDVEIDL